MNKLLLLILIYYSCDAFGEVVLNSDSKEEQRMDLIIELIKNNAKPNTGWRNIITYGSFPDYLYEQLKVIPYTFVTSNALEEDYYFEDAVRYSSNVILIECFNFNNYEDSFRQVLGLPNWHPHGNIILYYHNEEDLETIAKIFVSLWYYRAPNAVIFQYDDNKNMARITYYDPYSTDNYDITYKYGCWTTKNIGIPVYGFDEGFVCEPKCTNVTVKTKKRANNFGSCIGFGTLEIYYNESKLISKLNLFEDKGKNLHGYALRGFTTEVRPFIIIKVQDEDHYSLESRDGTVWSTLSQLMNFTIHLDDIINVMKAKFSFEINIQQIFAVAHRKGDMFLIPIYQFDVVVVDIDYTFPYRESGVCFMSHKAGFETILFDPNTLKDNHGIIIQLVLILLGMWTIFTLYSCLEYEQLTADLIGKNFMNTLRNIMLITLWKPPKSKSFRIFLGITIWSFFVINFSTQAAIISFFTAFKRGKEVETFEDIVQKGYQIEGIPTPDIVLPDTEERFRIINSRLTSTSDLFECIDKMSNDSRRFCLVDCSVGRYLERNKLNERGEQYLHIAKDRVHSHYLNLVFAKHSALTDYINKYVMIFFEAGLIKKWEQYRYNDIKEEAPVKALGMEDFKGIFNSYIACCVFTSVVFMLELLVGNFDKIILFGKLKYALCKRRFIKVMKRKQKRVMVSNSTQTSA